MPAIAATAHAEPRPTRARTALAAALALALAGATGCDGDEPDTDATGTERGAATERTQADGRRTAPVPVVRFSGSGDRVLPPIVVRSGGTTLSWTNRASAPVFSLLTQDAIVIDSSFERRGSRSLPAGRYVFEVVASGRWTLAVPNASRPR